MKSSALPGRTDSYSPMIPAAWCLKTVSFSSTILTVRSSFPFLKRKPYSIRPETERKFLETFAKPVIQKYKVNATGFTITDEHVKPNPVLSLESNISGMPVLMLRFRYGEKVEYLAGKKSELLVTLSESENSIDFTRLNRDYDYENQIISSLLELGLANLDASSFAPLRTKKPKTYFITYDLVNWLNINSSSLNILEWKLYRPILPIVTTSTVDLKLKVPENKNDWFDIHAVVQFDGFEIPFISFAATFSTAAGNTNYPTDRYCVLPEEWFARFKDLFSFARDNNDQLLLEKQHFPLLKESLKGLERHLCRQAQ